jgi:hypothetical protein
MAGELTALRDLVYERSVRNSAACRTFNDEAEAMTVPIELLIRVGEALYGEQWKAEIARALDVSARTVRRWAAGENPIPPWLGGELIPIIQTRRADLASLARELAKLPRK